MAASAHLDTFTRDHLPSGEHCPKIDLSGLPGMAAYAEGVNCATELLDNRARTHGTSPVLRFGAEVWSYADLLERANRIAAVLVEELGVLPGNRVLIRGFNTPMFVACWFGVVKAGAVVVPTMPLLRARELAYIADKAEVRVALCDSRLAEEIGKAESSFLERIVYFNDAELEERMAGKPAAFTNVETGAEDTCLISFTSGTTGQPKGCMHCHRDIMAVCLAFCDGVLKPEAGDVFAGSPPIAFTFGLGAQVLFPMYAGASTVLFEKFTPETLLQLVQDQGVTTLWTAPIAFRAMTDLAGKYDLSSLKACISAGETLPLAIWQGWYEATGIRIIDGIGSTELLHIFIACAGADIRPGATGKAIPGYAARVADEDGNDVPPGTVGRLAVRGPTGCRYLDNPERQAAYVRDGWNYTGDAYLMDEDGYFWYQARTDDMIISAGYNISGPEVEAVLLEHPKVGECAVVSAPDKERGNIVKAYVVLRDGAGPDEKTVDELKNFVKSQIAPYKYPRAVEFIDALPRTATGKVQRFVLRQRAEAEAGV